MAERIAMWSLGAVWAALFSTAVLALPALIAAHWLAARRSAAPLPRGWLESNLLLSAAAIGAPGALASADGCALALGLYSGTDEAAFLACFIAPVPLAAVPWVAGEMFSGVSERPVASFIAAAAVSSATSWLGYAAVWAGHPRTPL